MDELTPEEINWIVEDAAKEKNAIFYKGCVIIELLAITIVNMFVKKPIKPGELWDLKRLCGIEKPLTQEEIEERIVQENLAKRKHADKFVKIS